ncbi:hypothetical protein Acr_00g0051660 [Actinidia rufa]|uniref:Uncharacterized protein n=1 Tax=Actinidia rufa TaxID=165716 RepID=A0A7J0DL49_9ERIC|nr:hypothetical protein Acr_00g0051660 [Actinidia rufa]
MSSSPCPHYLAIDSVAFYEATFHAGLHLPIHPTIRRVLQFYICPSNSSLMRGEISSALWQYHKFRPLPQRIQKPVQLFQKSEARLWMAVLQGETEEDHVQGIPSNVKGWKKNFFVISGDDWEFFPGYPGTLGFQGS